MLVFPRSSDLQWQLVRPGARPNWSRGLAVIRLIRFFIASWLCKWSPSPKRRCVLYRLDLVLSTDGRSGQRAAQGRVC
jgi:hypothetical protein